MLDFNAAYIIQYYKDLNEEVVFIKASYISRIAAALLCLALILVPVNAFASSSSSISQTEEFDWVSAAKADVFEADLSKIKTMLENREITSEQLCETYIERINKYDKDTVKLNSMISINTNAIAQAKQMDKERSEGNIRGVLHGIPVVVKDNIDVSGFPTTLGKTSRKDAVAEQNAAAVELLVEQGAIILGKTNMSTDDSATRYTASAVLGETRNAYNTKLSAGGTSGGSAVSVSANLAAAALGTDTNGSMTFPAALNGTVAMRPTHALVDYTGCENVVKARDVVAPVAKSVADVAFLMDVLTESTDEMTYSKNLSKEALKGKTVAVLKELSQYTYNSPNEFRKSDKEITALFDEAIKKIEEMGGKVVTVSVPKLFVYFNNCRESNGNSANAKANLKAELKKLLDENGAEAFIFPTYLSAPLKSGFDEYASHNSTGETYLNCGAYLPSLVGLPAITVPMGMHSSGAASGIEFVSLAGSDAQLLSLAYAYEAATELRAYPKQTPNLYKVVERPQKPQDNSDSEQVSSDVQSDETENAPMSDKTEKIVVAAIVIAILILCIWVLVFGSLKSRNKNLPKNRHF